MVIAMSRDGIQTMDAVDTEPDESNPSDLSGSIAILKRRWWLLILVPILLAVGVYELSSLRAANYSATATLLVSNVGAPSGNPSNDVTAATLLAQTYRGLVTSPPVLQGVITDLHLPESPMQLSQLVTVAADPSSQVIRITTKYRSAQTAANISNSVGDHFVTFLADLQKAGLNQSSQTLRDSIDKARRDRDNASTELAALQAAPGTPTPEQAARITSLNALLSQYQTTYSNLLELQQRVDLTQFAPQNGVSLVVRALAPSNPAGSIRLLATVGAFLAGFGGTVVGIVMAEQASPRVRSRKDVRRASDLPMLIAVPATHDKDAIEVVREPRSAMSEAIHSLRAQIWLEARNREATAILVTNPGPREGASIVAANLAVSFAQAGQRTILVDGDLTEPSLWKMFAKDPKHPGLAELSAVPALEVEDVLTAGPHDNLHLLLAGPVSVIPTERLTNERLEKIVADLRRRADVLIIAAPPPLTHSDTLLYAAVADQAVVVASAGRTHMDALRMTLESIRAMKAPVLGLVLYGVDRNGPSA
jgi:capsular exopolysaccharide synthesis family protein